MSLFSRKVSKPDAKVNGGKAAEVGSDAGSDVQMQLASLRQENEELLAAKKRLQEENDALKGKSHLLQFKVELLLDMVTLANLDCDKLEDELEAATGGGEGS